MRSSSSLLGSCLFKDRRFAPRNPTENQKKNPEENCYWDGLNGLRLKRNEILIEDSFQDFQRDFEPASRAILPKLVPLQGGLPPQSDFKSRFLCSILSQPKSSKKSQLKMRSNSSLLGSISIKDRRFAPRNPTENLKKNLN